MKCLSLLCLLLLLSCGSPLDQGYWDEHNEEAEINPDQNTTRSFDIDFETLHQNIDMTLSGETFSRSSDQKVSLSVSITHPAEINISEFRIRNDACPAATNIYTFGNANQQSTFTRNSVDLIQVSNDVSRNLEDQFIYLRGTINGATGILDIACSQIRL